MSGGASINNNGTWPGPEHVRRPDISERGRHGNSFINIGTYTKSGAGTTTINIGFSNSGTVNVDAGTLALTGGLSNFSGTTLTGGSYAVTGPGILEFTGANIVTNAASIILDGPGPG